MPSDYDYVKKTVIKAFQSFQMSFGVDFVSAIETIHVHESLHNHKENGASLLNVYIALDYAKTNIPHVTRWTARLQHHVASLLCIPVSHVHIGYTNHLKNDSLKKNTPAKETEHPLGAMVHKMIPCVKKIVLVASGKGGVGKSTTALNLALSMADQGLKVGLLDADIYGPSLGILVNHQEKPDVTDHKKLIPLFKYNLSLMSMGFLVHETQAIMWRGPMVQNALKQLLFDVDWGYHQDTLDVLVIDTPPGTGDVHLSLIQNLTIDGVVIVSTPQDVSLIDAKKAHHMFKKLDVPILGIIENMSYYSCPHCGHCEDIFGKDGPQEMARTMGIAFLGRIPLLKKIRLACDQGIPTETHYYDESAKKIKNALGLTNAPCLFFQNKNSVL